MKYNSKNERVKRQYFKFLKEAKGQNGSTIDGVAMALTKFEEYHQRKDFSAFHFEQAVAFKKHLAKQLNDKTGKPLAKATINSTLNHLKVFFQWLCLQVGYKSKLHYSDMEYFNLSDNDVRVAQTRREKRVPSIEQIEHVIDHMPSSNPLEMRNRALIAFTLLTGARDSAIASFKIKHVDLIDRSVYQDGREVKTKFSKTFRTNFFPVGDIFNDIFLEWVSYLKTELLFGEDDPLFPKTKLSQNNKREFKADGLLKEHWSNASPIRKIFKTSFESAGLEYYNPHSFRDTIGRLGEKICQSPEQFKAWSQNLGHESVMTTFNSYGEVPQHRQAEVFDELNVLDKKPVIDFDILVKKVAKEINKQN